MTKLRAAVIAHRALLPRTAGCSEGAPAAPRPAGGTAPTAPQGRCGAPQAPGPAPGPGPVLARAGAAAAGLARGALS